VTWYSEDEYHRLLNILDDVKELLEIHENFYGSYTHIERALRKIEEGLENG
jgi:hypothetical protein